LFYHAIFHSNNFMRFWNDIVKQISIFAYSIISVQYIL
jgi:hypothetical protein